MTARVKKDFTSGPIFMPMMAFVLPIILTNILQTFYNIADNIVVGKFSGEEPTVCLRQRHAEWQTFSALFTKKGESSKAHLLSFGFIFSDESYGDG